MTDAIKVLLQMTSVSLQPVPSLFVCFHAIIKLILKRTIALLLGRHVITMAATKFWPSLS
jgi:hypothetical protein